MKRKFKKTIWIPLLLGTGVAWLLIQVLEKSQSGSEHTAEKTDRTAEVPPKNVGTPSTQTLGRNVSTKRESESPPPEINSGGNRDVPNGARFRKDHSAGPFDAAEKVRLKGTGYSLVTNLRGTMTEMEENQAFSVNGISYYESEADSDPKNVVFDHSSKMYGLWSGEVEVFGSDDAIVHITKMFDLELISVDNRRAHLKAGREFSIDRDLSKLGKVTGIEGVRLDLRFGKLKRQ